MPDNRPKRRAVRATLTDANNNNDSTGSAAPRRSTRRSAKPESPGPKKPPDPLPGRRRSAVDAKQKLSNRNEDTSSDSEEEVVDNEHAKGKSRDDDESSPKALLRRTSSRTRTMQPGGNRPPPRRLSPQGKRKPPSSSDSSSDDASKNAEMDDEEEQQQNQMDSDSSSKSEGESKQEHQSDDNNDDDDSGDEEDGKRLVRNRKTRATLTKPKAAPAPASSRPSLRRSTRAAVKDSPRKEAADSDDSDEEDRGDDGEKESEDDKDSAGEGRPQLRQSKRARRPPAKIVEPRSSSSDTGDPKTPIISNFGKRRSRTSASGSQKHRRKVLTDGKEGTKAKKPAKSRASKRSSITAGENKPKRGRGRPPKRLLVQESGSDTDEYQPERYRGRYPPSDADDETLSTYRDDASLLGSENEDPWCHSPATHQSRRAAESELLHQTHQLGYSWEELHLGTQIGTASLNEYLRDQLREITVRTGYARGRSVPQFTAQQCLPMIQSLRAATILPPPKSELHSVVQPHSQDLKKLKGDGEEYMEVSVDMEEEGDEDSAGGQDEKKASSQFFYGPKIPFASLATVYEKMCQQDVDDGREVQRQAQFLTPEACVQRLRGLDETVRSLREREQRVLQTAKSVGLMPADSSSSNVEVNRLLGCIPRDANELSDED